MTSRPFLLSEDEISKASGSTGMPIGYAKSPFGYFGSKQRLALRIAQILPPHNAWVEAFCGSAAVTMAKKAAPIEIINDANQQIVNLFHQMRENTVELLRLI